MTMLAFISSLLALLGVAATSPGVLSVGPTQYARVNLLFAPSKGEIGFEPPDPCVVDVTVFDGKGNSVKTQEFSLNNVGQSAGLTFNRSDLNGGGNNGIFSVQSSVKDTCNGAPGCDATLCSISQSIEVVDDLSGATRALVPAPVKVAITLPASD
jgi:hypothetical protein